MEFSLDKPEFTLSYFKWLNEKCEELGFPKIIIDEENMVVYQDAIHKVLGLGVKLEGP